MNKLSGGEMWLIANYWSMVFDALLPNSDKHRGMETMCCLFCGYDVVTIIYRINSFNHAFSVSGRRMFTIDRENVVSSAKFLDMYRSVTNEECIS